MTTMNLLGYTVTALWLGLSLTAVALHGYTRMRSTTPPSAQTQARLAVAHRHLTWLITLAGFSAATVWTQAIDHTHWIATVVFGALTLAVLTRYIQLLSAPERSEAEQERAHAIS
ncbi:hypothetical protein CH267_26610 [Rhodococcus sp. 06-621-2]|nr:MULTISPECIES: hypothetical protein [unclassified Rhodococcus (in: high G+C Gram-positive bacteria)]OZC47595.1 hypothetical protein CH267_26610 [Rhodococcus sp. 06-621-2]OZD74293.1 hypothetical protein CH263_01120 [Rhodococcus sp. 06-1059B-a]